MKTFDPCIEHIIHESPDEPVTDFHAVHLWFCDLDATQQLDFTGLPVCSSGERLRLARLKQPLDRWRYAARCHFVRHVLGKVLGVPPAGLQFRNGTRGRPRLAFPIVVKNDRFALLEFNLSQADNLLALAVAFDREVAIDIEVVNPGAEAPGAAEMFFEPKNGQHPRALPHRQSSVAFDYLWTRQEALAKARGRGVATRAFCEPSSATTGTELRSFHGRFGGVEIIGTVAATDHRPETKAAAKTAVPAAEHSSVPARLQRRDEDLGNFWLQRRRGSNRRGSTECLGNRPV